MASGAARAVRNRGAKRVDFAPTVVVPTARAHGVNMMSVATAHEPPRGAAPFAADEENSGRSRAPEPCGTVLATSATGVRVRFASFRPLLAGHFDQRCERRALAAGGTAAATADRIGRTPAVRDRDGAPVAALQLLALAPAAHRASVRRR